MERLRSLIKEVLTVQPKKDCNCGCGGCGKKSPVITENRIKKAISEGLTYHVENKIPLHESVYRIGSEKHFALINEARKLWVRELIDVSEDDQAILETHLGNFGMYEGEKVPLDMPMMSVNEDVDMKKVEEKLKLLKKENPGKRISYDFINGGVVYKIDGKMVNEEKGYGADTAWKDEEGNKVTLEDILDMTKNIPQKDYPTEKLAKVVLNWDDNPKEVERIDQVEVSKQYPILIMVGEDEKIKWILDGNHRAQKALRSKSETIPAKLIKPSNLSSKAKKILLGVVEESLNEAKTLKNNDKYLGYSASEQIYYVKDSKTGKEVKHTENAMAQLYGSDWKESLDEAKKKKKKEKKDPPLGKPKRGGSKAYYVYVRDPKTKRIKKVSFGSGGLRAKIKNKEARKRFASRHNCDKKKDRTTAGYWSCNLPRYAEQLGLGSNMSTFW